MPTFEIRAPRRGEAEVLAAVHTAAWRETYAGVLPVRAWDDESLARRVHLWRALCDERRPEWRTAIAELDGVPIGVAHAAPEPEDDAPSGGLRLFLLYVLASRQGSGAGRALHDAVLGARVASLWVLDGNERAIAFYRRAGFGPDGERRASGFEDAPDELRFVRAGSPSPAGVERIDELATRAHLDHDRITQEDDTDVD